jgi:hypothetical protein
MVEYVIPSVPQEESPRYEAKTPEKLEQAEITLLRTGNTFLAYVTVDAGGTKEDLAGPALDFFYASRGATWAPIPGCSKVSVCDAEAVVSGGVSIKAEFSQQGYSPASSVFSIPASASF